LSEFDDAAQARDSDGITATAEGQLEMPRHVPGIVLAGSAQPFAQVGSDRSDAILPRLRKDRPDLHARVLAGEYVAVLVECVGGIFGPPLAQLPGAHFRRIFSCFLFQQISPRGGEDDRHEVLVGSLAASCAQWLCFFFF
jgi:hypothetical protein